MYTIILWITILVLIYDLVTKWRMYWHTWYLPGPKTFPLIGSIGYLFQIYKDPLKGITESVQNSTQDRVAIWMGPQLIFVTIKPEDIEIIYNHPSALDKIDQIYSILVPLVGHGLIVSKSTVFIQLYIERAFRENAIRVYFPAQQWKKHRKLLTPPFARTTLDSFTDSIYEKSEILIRTIQSEHCPKGNTQDCFLTMFNYSFETFCSNFLNVEVENYNRTINFGRLIYEHNEIMFSRVFHPLLMFDSIFKWTEMGRRSAEVVNQMQTFTQNITGWYLNQSNGSEPNPKKKSNLFLEHLVNLRKCGKLNQIQFEDEIMTFIIGGSDTSGLGLGFINVVLGIYPKIQDEIYDEIISVVGMTGPIRNTHLSQLKYVERAICEVLRLFPIVPNMGRQIHKDITLSDGMILPQGIAVGVAVLALHRNPKYWPDPLKFDPDRFLPEACAARNPYTYLPFSIGSRNCIGMRYGMLVLKIAVTNIIRNFRIVSKYKRIEDIEPVAHIFANLPHGFHCDFLPRNPPKPVTK